MKILIFNALKNILLNTHYGYYNEKYSMPVIVFSVDDETPDHDTENHYPTGVAQITVIAKTMDEVETITEQIKLLDYTDLGDDKLTRFAFNSSVNNAVVGGYSSFNIFNFWREV